MRLSHLIFEKLLAKIALNKLHIPEGKFYCSQEKVTSKDLFLSLFSQVLFELSNLLRKKGFPFSGKEVCESHIE
jgi:hypothetical protein